MKLQKADGAAISASLIWGVNFSFTKISLDYAPPFLLGLLRFIIAGLALAFVLRAVEGSLRTARRPLSRMFLSGGVIVCQQICFLIGLYFLDASLAALVTAFTSALMMVISALVARERLTLMMMIGVGIACIGMTMVVLMDTSGVMLSSNSLIGIVLVLSAGILAGIPPLVNKSVLASNSPTRVTMWMMLVGAMFFFPLGLGEGNAGTILHIPWPIWLVILFTALGGTAIANICWNYGISRIGVVRMTVYGYLPPILGIVSSTVLLHETMGVWQWCGVICTLIGIVVSQYDKLLPLKKHVEECVPEIPVAELALPETGHKKG